MMHSIYELAIGLSPPASFAVQRQNVVRYQPNSFMENVKPLSVTLQMMEQWSAGKWPATEETMDDLVSVRDLMLQFYAATGSTMLNEDEVMQYLTAHEYRVYPGQVGVYMVRNAF